MEHFIRLFRLTQKGGIQDEKVAFTTYFDSTYPVRLQLLKGGWGYARKPACKRNC
jgi:hypothetical protein